MLFKFIRQGVLRNSSYEDRENYEHDRFREMVTAVD